MIPFHAIWGLFYACIICVFGVHFDFVIRLTTAEFYHRPYM